MSSSREESAHLFLDVSSCLDESAHRLSGMNTRLYKAAEEGNVDELVKLIDEAKLNIFQEFTPLGNSALHIAVSKSELSFIERLLEKVNKDLGGRGFVRAKNSDGNTALHLAAFHNHFEIVKKLIGVMEGDVEDGADFLRSVNHEGNTALHEAAKEGWNYKVVDVLLKHDAGLASISNAAGETAFFIACQSGRFNKRLLDCMTPDCNMKRHDGQTPLHSAVFNRHTGVIKELLQQRPDLAKQTDQNQRTALHMLALRTNYWSFWEDMRDSQNVDNIAGLFLEKDNWLCYKQDINKQTPLHMAVATEKYDLVEILLRYGRDCIEVVDKDGRKPLHLAVMNTEGVAPGSEIKFMRMVYKLISWQSLNHRDSMGQTPLQIAMENLRKQANPSIDTLSARITDMFGRKGTLVTPEMMVERRKLKLSLPTEPEINAGAISTNAVLICTVSFAAAFTFPGGLTQSDEDKEAVFKDKFLFKLFLICDTISFCCSIVSIMLVQTYRPGSKRQSKSLLTSSIYLLWLALLSLLVAFGAAVQLVITPSPWLSGIVWTMLYLVPPAIHIMRFPFKADFNKQEKQTNQEVLEMLLTAPFAWIIIIFEIIFHTLRSSFLKGLFYNVGCWISKLRKIGYQCVVKMKTSNEGKHVPK